MRGAVHPLRLFSGCLRAPCRQTPSPTPAPNFAKITPFRSAILRQPETPFGQAQTPFQAAIGTSFTKEIPCKP
ncbi:hypothetical protein [Kingella oralis]|uniref:hypothetical protein n=1 Tax=Kingella oralis TaxID=505 RepID=UPI0034E4B90A